MGKTIHPIYEWKGIKSLSPHSPWGLTELDMTKRLHFHFPALEKEMAPHSSVLAWRIPGTGEPGGLPSMGSHRVRHDCSDSAAAAAAFTLLFNMLSAAAAAAKSLQSCPTLCDPIDGSWPGSSVPGILQARTQEWVAISFSNA